jgi:ParB/RepB/Spo0J family partition protein
MALKNHAREAKDVAPAHQAGEGSGEAPARALHLQAVLIAVDEIAEDPNNPRRRAASEAEDAELVASVREVGVLQPVLVRPWGPADLATTYSLVFGHRRLRAAKAARLEKIPAIVREMSDVEVLEAQLVENAARAGVHPLDEGLAYVRLAEMGRSVEEIAAKVGRSRATVYARMKLCDLAPKVRAAFEQGKLEASHALLLARVPTRALQEEALKALSTYRGEIVPYKQAVQILHNRFMRQLRVAPDLRPLGIDGARGQKMTARNAVASTFGLRGSEYAPQVQT